MAFNDGIPPPLLHMLLRYAVAEWLGAGAGSGEVAIAAGAGPLELLEAVVRWPATIAENLGAMFRPPEGALPPMSPLQ